jgi:phosphoribosylaminoimidazolecarboxamide formyltransferase / IMP cyclohydrolase
LAIERALISVYDKTGIVEFASALECAGAEIVSTGGTAKLLREAGVKVRDVSELTGWPEMLGGRVKTLHPKVHGGILFRRGRADDLEQTRAHDVSAVDAVVVNLYPFAATAARADVTVEELIENIDIGGPAMIRSAAKNFESVAVITDPSDYAALAAELAGQSAEQRTENRGDKPSEECGAQNSNAGWSLATRLRLAQKAFAATARYDEVIATELQRVGMSGDAVTLEARPDARAARPVASHVSSAISNIASNTTFKAESTILSPGEPMPVRLQMTLARQAALRYGENPHQQAALYISAGRPASGLAGARQLQGKELSYNNLVDLDAAWDLAQEFSAPSAVIVKHSNPCGAAEQPALAEAYRQALATDPVSAFGGVMAFNRPLDSETAAEVAKLFVECIVAPGYAPAAREALAGKKNLRLMEIAQETGPESSEAEAELELKRISGAVLVQEPDRRILDASDLKTVTKRPPSSEELADMLFAWKVAKHVKSNAIVFARGARTLGVGAGQMSRVDSTKIAVMKANESLKGSVVASDAFFPFPDGIEEAARAGATAVIQPGGSVRDNDVVAAADRLGLAMVFTGIRHFKH